MGLFDIFKGKSWEEKNTYTGETPPCPQCGNPLTKKYVYSGMYCENCRYGLEDDDDEVRPCPECGGCLHWDGEIWECSNCDYTEED